MGGFRLWLVQSVYRILHRSGRGGSFPGSLALAMDKNFIRRFQMPPIVILVTGTNGKTTTSNLIAESLRAGGLKVINNHRGDNLNVGIATLLASGSDSRYVIQADAAVIEVDELTLWRQFKDLKPTMLVVTNFFRDQLDRAGEMETIIRKIADVCRDFHVVLRQGGGEAVAVGVFVIVQGALSLGLHVIGDFHFRRSDGLGGIRDRGVGAGSGAHHGVNLAFGDAGLADRHQHGILVFQLGDGVRAAGQ